MNLSSHMSRSNRRRGVSNSTRRTGRSLRRFIVEPLEERRLLNGQDLLAPDNGPSPLVEDIPMWNDVIQDERMGGGIGGISAAPAGEDVSPPPSYTTIRNNGPSSNRVDIVILGDGYTSSQLATNYASHINAMLQYFFEQTQDPLPRYRNFFNAHRVDVVSNQSGADVPPLGIYRDTALDASYYYDNVTDRLLYVNEYKADTALNGALQGAGFTAEMRLVTVNDTRYGGGGGKYAVWAGGNSSATDVALHETGHSFAHLADEYDYSGGATYTGGEPAAINATKSSTGAKWAAWLGYTDPAHSQVGTVGAFQGAMYHTYGIYRPTTTSKMQALGMPFNAPSREAFIREIYRLVRPLDGYSSNTSTVGGIEPEVWVDVVDPNVIAVQWFVDGNLVTGATAESFCPTDYGIAPGIHTVRGRAYDPTDWVRIDRSALEQSVTWTVQIDSPIESLSTEITVLDNSGAVDDASVQFSTPLSQYRVGPEDSPLVRPAFPDNGHYVDVTNNGLSPLRLSETQINVANVSLDILLTSDPGDDLMLASGQTQRFRLTYAPTAPTLSGAAGENFSVGNGLVILSNAINTPQLAVALRGASTFDADITCDGQVNLSEVGVLNANHGKSSGGANWDPTADMTGDGKVNLSDLGPLNAQYGKRLPMVLVSESSGSTAVDEGGENDTYTVVLLRQPTASVTVSIVPDAQTTVDPAELTFTTADWNSSRTVTVQAVDDALAEGSHVSWIGHAVTSADVAYNGLPVMFANSSGRPVLSNTARLKATVSDNDASAPPMAPTVADSSSIGSSTSIGSSQEAGTSTRSLPHVAAAVFGPRSQPLTAAAASFSSNVSVPRQKAAVAVFSAVRNKAVQAAACDAVFRAAVPAAVGRATSRVPDPAFACILEDFFGSNIKKRKRGF